MHANIVNAVVVEMIRLDTLCKSTIFKEIIQCDSERRLASEGNGEILVRFVFPTSSLAKI